MRCTTIILRVLALLATVAFSLYALFLWVMHEDCKLHPGCDPHEIAVTGTILTFLDQFAFHTFATPIGRGVVPCEYYVFLTGGDVIEHCIAELYRARGRYSKISHRYEGLRQTAICMAGVAGARTRIEINIYETGPRASPTRNVANWEILCAVRRELHSCAGGLVHLEPEGRCDYSSVDATLVVLEAPGEGSESFSELYGYQLLHF